jgi:hypothetical protein
MNTPQPLFPPVAGPMISPSLLPTAPITLPTISYAKSISDNPVFMNVPRDECCRGLPGDALCVPCNADPLSLSAPPHGWATQQGQLALILLLLQIDEYYWDLPGDAPCVPCNVGPRSLLAQQQDLSPMTADSNIHRQTYLPSPLPIAVSSKAPINLLPHSPPGMHQICSATCLSDKSVLMNVPREECCKGLPGDAQRIPCNADPLSLSAISKRMVCQLGPETRLVLLLPREECCRSLPGDALCIPCNAGPLSLSAYPQSSTSQTADTVLPRSNHLQSHLNATDCPMPLPTTTLLPVPIHPYNEIEGNLNILWNAVLYPPLKPLQNTHNLPGNKAPSRMTHPTPFPLLTAGSMLSSSLLPTPSISPTLIRYSNRVSDKSVLMNVPREECCKGLPGNALNFL